MSAKTLSYLRFVGPAQNPGLAARKGILKVAYEAMRNPDLAAGMHDDINDLIIWFERNLKVPPKFRTSASKGWRQHQPGLSWFKSTATTHVAKAMELKALLDDRGYPITVLRETRIGYIVWEDDHQAVAEPFADTRT